MKAYVLVVYVGYSSGQETIGPSRTFKQQFISGEGQRGALLE